jgi:hypothetical protein
MVALHSHLPTPPPLWSPALTVRDLGPADEALVERLHTSLSPRSQYQRFHGVKPRLSSRERRFLAGADGRDHVALVALERGAPVAIARFVRLRDRPAIADVAAEVVDDRQNQGVGSDLVFRLARRAATLDVHRFTATVLSETGLRRSLVRRGWQVVDVDGPTATLEVDVWTLLARP